MALKIPYKKFLIDFFITTLPAFFISALLFAGGIILLFLKIPGWSLFLGLPAVQIGLVLLIFTFDAVGQRKSIFPSKEYHLVNCLVCGHQTTAPKYMQKRICDDCQVKIAQNVKSVAVILYILISIPLTVALIAQDQRLRKQAFEQPPACDAGKWYPLECRCGTWEQNQCPPEKRARNCQGKIFCCFQKEDQVWHCQLLGTEL